MPIYKNRYQAEQAREIMPCFSMADKIVKVCGGYTIMTPDQYQIWKKQK